MTDINLTYPDRRYDYTSSIFNKFPTKRTVGAVSANIQSTDKTKTTNGNNNNKNNFSKTAFLACIIGGGMLFLSKGVQKHTTKTLEKIRDTLEGKLDTSVLKDSHKKSSFYEYSLRRINSFLLKSESINNINSLKDILFMKSMYSTAPTKKVHKGISDFFEKLSINTIKKSYKKTQKDFDEMYKIFDDLDDYILRTSGDELVTYRDKKIHKNKKVAKKELIKEAKNFRDTVKMVTDAFIMDKTQDVRYGYIKQSTTNLYTNFWNESFKGFWTKDNKFKRKEMWQTFIASEQIKGNKTHLAKNVAFTRQVLSFTDKEKLLFISGYLKNLDAIMPPKDIEGANIVKKLQWLAKNTNSIKNNKELFLKELKKLKKHNLGNNKTLMEDKETNIKLIKSMIKDKATGELQDMLDIYYKIAPFELSKSGALKSAQKAVSSFDKSVNLEVGEFFDKERDLGLGSAPTDVLTLLFSCGMITYGLNKAKGKDEKTSVILKSGIPIVGAVGTSLISATKLVAGSKSIALGLISGLVLNRIGTHADKIRKGYTNNAALQA